MRGAAVWLVLIGSLGTTAHAQPKQSPPPPPVVSCEFLEVSASAGWPGPGEITTPAMLRSKASPTRVSLARATRTSAPATRNPSTSMNVKLSSLSTINRRGR